MPERHARKFGRQSQNGGGAQRQRETSKMCRYLQKERSPPLRRNLCFGGYGVVPFVNRKACHQPIVFWLPMKCCEQRGRCVSRSFSWCLKGTPLIYPCRRTHWPVESRIRNAICTISLSLASVMPWQPWLNCRTNFRKAPFFGGQQSGGRAVSHWLLPKDFKTKDGASKQPTTLINGY